MNCIVTRQFTKNCGNLFSRFKICGQSLIKFEMSFRFMIFMKLYVWMGDQRQNERPIYVKISLTITAFIKMFMEYNVHSLLIFFRTVITNNLLQFGHVYKSSAIQLSQFNPQTKEVTVFLLPHQGLLKKGLSANQQIVVYVLPWRPCGRWTWRRSLSHILAPKMAWQGFSGYRKDAETTWAAHPPSVLPRVGCHGAQWQWPSGGCK